MESDEDEVPKTAEENGLLCSMDIQTIQGIVQNAKQQTGSGSAKQLFEAFLYYWNHDAHVCFDNE